MTKVVCVVLNDIRRDVRVLKEARSLQAVGYDVEIVGIRRGTAALELQHEGLSVTLAGYPGQGRAVLLRRVAIAAVLGLLLVSAMALAYVGFAAIAHRLSGLGNQTAAALVATAAATVLALRRRRAMIAAVRSVRRNIRIWRAGGRAAEDAAPYAEPAPRQPPTALTLAMAGLDPRSSAWIAQLNDAQDALCRVLHGKEMDILHCHDFTTLRVGTILKRAEPRLKLVYDSHELYSAVQRERAGRYHWIRLSEARASRLIDACITVNDSIAAELKSYYPRLPRPVVVCNATPQHQTAGVSDVDAAPETADDGRLHRAAKLAANRKILLFQGGFARHRGLQILTMAATFLPEDWCLVYMGWGSYEKEMRAIAAIVDEHGEHIRFVPPAPQRELAAWTAGATIGVIPYEPVSLNHLYCSPNKLWEYPRSGVPVLCSDMPEMTRRVVQYGFGWIIPHNELTPRGIAEIIAALGPEDIARARSACRSFMAVDNWRVYETRLLDLYRGIGVVPTAPAAQEASQSPPLDFVMARGVGPG